MIQLKKYKLSDVATVEISGVDKKNKDGEVTVKLFNFTDVYYNWSITKNMEDSFMVASANANEIHRFSLKKGQVAFTKDSETRDDIGIPAYIADDFENVILGYHCALITPDETKVLGAYINAFMHTSLIQKYFANNASGSGQRYSLSVETMERMPLFLPSLEEQKRVADLFTNLNSKIALNRQINQNLEALAKQLYDYWFVQFDFPDENGKPYKSSGGEMKYDAKLKKEIPIDWHCGNLFEIANFTNGLACQNYRPKEEEHALPVIKIREMRDGFTNDTEFVRTNIHANVKVYNGDILFSWSASLEVMLWAYGDGGLNQHIFKVTPANGFPKSFYYYQLLNYVDVFKHIADARKTTMGHITQDHLLQSTIAIPNDVEIAYKLEKRIAPIFEAIINNQVEISDLIKQRDELLPLLMNGQVNFDLSAC